MADGPDGHTPDAAADVLNQPGVWDNDAPIMLRIMRAAHDVKTITEDQKVKRKSKKSGDEVTYGGVSSAQIVANCKAALHKHGVVFWPVIDKGSHQLNGNKCTMWVDGHFHSVDNPTDHMMAGAWGEGTDFADHAHQKAHTNAVKQILLKALMLTSVEDNDDETKRVTHEPEGSSQAVADAESNLDTAVRTWADAYKAAIDGATDASDLALIQAANEPMLAMANVSERVKTYFKEYAAKKAAQLMKLAENGDTE